MPELCKACSEPLYLEVDPDFELDQDSEADDDDHMETGGPSFSSHPSGQPQQIPDDLLLPCSCHFHWQCLMDLSSTVALSLRCPSCNAYLPSNTSGPSSNSGSAAVPISATNPILPTSQGISILCQYHNEGGVQSSLDILPALTEEAYLSSNPQARPARAMHTMAAEGDFAGIIELLTDVAAAEDEEEGGQSITPSELLTFRDPLNEGKTALHLAVENEREEVFWLLLWLGSGLQTEVFPNEVVQVANGVGVGERRVEVGREEDVRWVRDERGRSVREVCAEKGRRWGEMVAGGLFD